MSAAIHDATFGALVLRQCTQASFQPNNQVDVGRESGSLNPSALYISGGEPRARWQTHDIVGLLGAISITAGLYVGSGTIQIPWRRRAAGGTFAGNTAHLQLSGTKGLLIPSAIEASQGSPKASASVEAVLLSTDGQAEPVTSVINATPAALAYNLEFRLGPVLLNGAQVPKITGFTVTPGIEIELEYADGATFPTDVFIVLRTPTIEIRFRDEQALDTYGPLFSTMEDLTCFLRKKVEGGTVLGDAEDEHISFAFADGIASVEEISASGNATSEPGLRLHGEEITVSTTAVIDLTP